MTWGLRVSWIMCKYLQKMCNYLYRGDAPRGFDWHVWSFAERKHPVQSIPHLAREMPKRIPEALLRVSPEGFAKLKRLETYWYGSGWPQCTSHNHFCHTLRWKLLCQFPLLCDLFARRDLWQIQTLWSVLGVVYRPSGRCTLRWLQWCSLKCRSGRLRDRSC